MNLLIIYEHQLLADGLKVILEPNPSILSVNLLSLEQASTQSIQSFAPDVLLIDCQQSHHQVASLLEDLSVQNANLATFVIGVDQWMSSPSVVTKVFQLNSGLKDLLSEINALKANSNQKLFNETYHYQTPFFSKYGISLREAQVIAYIMQGESSSSISEKLFISIHTVNTHKRNIYHKLSVPNERELIKFVQSRFKTEHSFKAKN